MAKRKSKKKLKSELTNEEANIMDAYSEGLVMSGSVMTATPVMSTSTVDTLDVGFTYSHDDIGMEMRDKYPALQQAHEHYQSVLEICKTKEKEEDEN